MQNPDQCLEATPPTLDQFPSLQVKIERAILQDGGLLDLVNSNQRPSSAQPQGQTPYQRPPGVVSAQPQVTAGVPETWVVKAAHVSLVAEPLLGKYARCDVLEVAFFWSF